MDFIQQIQTLAARVPAHREHLSTEEAAKTALVLPFINALGYNVFDPREVVPEFTADVGIKKGEKVDYAIMRGGQPIMLFECKGAGVDLSRGHASQLYRYFSVTSARVGVLTNGLVYHFFSDLDQPNRMDEKPFLEFDLLNIQESLLAELKRLTKDGFDPDSIAATAGELKRTKDIARILASQMTKPDEEMVRLLAAQVYQGQRLTKAVMDQFADTVKKAFRMFVNDQVSQRFRSALQGSDEVPPETEVPGDVATTMEEVEGLHIVRAILAQKIDPDRIAARDVKSYFGVLLDNNNRKPICRLHFNTANKYVGLFDNPERAEERTLIERPRDLYRFATRLLATVALYEKGVSDVAPAEGGGPTVAIPQA